MLENYRYPTENEWGYPIQNWGDAARSFHEVGMSVQEASARLKEWEKKYYQKQWRTSAEFGDALLNSYRPKKVITDITIEREVEHVDVRTWDGDFTAPIPGLVKLRILDQDGEEVPVELWNKVEELVRDARASPADVMRVLDEYNDLATEERGEVERPEGHKEGCLYAGTHHYPCSCQPPTLWGKTYLYHCDCCDEPRAEVHHGLCGLCDSHQLQHLEQVELEHGVRAMKE